VATGIVFVCMTILQVFYYDVQADLIVVFQGESS
jgi:hypothetical protein